MIKFTAFGIHGWINFPHSIHHFFRGVFQGKIHRNLPLANTAELKVLFSRRLPYFS